MSVPSSVPALPVLLPVPSVISASSSNTVQSSVPVDGPFVGSLLSADVFLGVPLSRSASAGSFAVNLDTPPLRSSTSALRSVDSSALIGILAALPTSLDTGYVVLLVGARLGISAAVRELSRGSDGIRALRPFVGSRPNADVPPD